MGMHGIKDSAVQRLKAASVKQRYDSLTGQKVTISFTTKESESGSSSLTMYITDLVKPPQTPEEFQMHATQQGMDRTFMNTAEEIALNKIAAVDNSWGHWVGSAFQALAESLPGW